MKERAEQIAKESGRPLIHLSSPKESKEDFVREIIERDQITAGLICVLTCVEPCCSFSIRGDRASKRLKLVAQTRQCQHLYFYFLDDEFGLLHVRLQTWLPLTIQVCLNGREYLARQLLRESISFTQADNCFTAIGDFAGAQQLSDQLVTRKWKPFLDMLARRVNPWLEHKSEIRLHSYYWTIRQGEYATDILFRDRQALADIYPALIEHAIKHFHTEDVLRFLGRKARYVSSGEVKSMKVWSRVFDRPGKYPRRLPVTKQNIGGIFSLTDGPVVGVQPNLALMFQPGIQPAAPTYPKRFSFYA